MASINPPLKKDELTTPFLFNNMLVYILAHDLRQPFSTVVMMADMIKHTQRTLDDQELYTILADMRNVSIKSIGLLDGLLSWIKSQRTDYVYETQPLLLNDLIYEANELYLHDQFSKNVALYNVVPDRQLIFADRQMLQFINRNILSHSTKRSPKKGIIAVTCSIENDWITVAFTDQGSGISDEQFEKLFVRNDTITTENYMHNGSGIAMSICNDIIHHMGGEIWVESKPGEGATFYYTLPFIEKETTT